MRRRIEQTVEVIEEVRKQFRSVKDMRIAATWVVANREVIKYPTVQSKYSTQLEDITDTPHFDKLLDDFLVHGSDELKNILLKESKDNEEAELINNAFL